jgi:hypothetical protein
MFEITADDIALLNDEDLGTLVELLCEFEATWNFALVCYLGRKSKC